MALTADARRLPRWYFGGVASALAVCVTHPLDTLKVILQTQRGEHKSSITEMVQYVVKREGYWCFYNGLSASVVRQLTYSTMRFAVYDLSKVYFGPDMSFPTRMFVTAVVGGVAGLIGSPADKVNVRMQNDIKLPKEKRYNYKHAFHGLWMVYKENGVKNLFAAGHVAMARTSLQTVGQIAFYDEMKELLIETKYFKDNITTHLVASFGAGAVASALTHPLDVIKTRIMQAKPGKKKQIIYVVRFTAKSGPKEFFKGFWPAFLRNGPQTVFTFLFYEQMRLYLGYLPQES